MAKRNCWEFKKCGRDRVGKRGLCPVLTAHFADGTNDGRNGGRVCWAIAGTCCDGRVQGTYAQKILSCSDCDFRLKVREEEGYRFRPIFF